MRTAKIVLATTLFVALAATASFAAVYQLDNGDMGYDSRMPALAVDSDGMVHVANRGYLDNSDYPGWENNEHVLYHLVDPADGDELIDDTWLTVGDESGTPEFRMLPDGTLAFIFHQASKDVYLAVLDPSLHPLDGSDANAMATTPVADGGNTGNGTMSSVQTAAAVTRTEDWTVTFDGTDWSVTGSVSGTLDSVALSDNTFRCTDEDGSPEVLSFLIESGGIAFASGDEFTFSTTASPILVEPAMPVSGTDGDYNHDAGTAIGPDGRVFVGWRFGSYTSDDTEVQYRLFDPAAKASTAEMSLWEGGMDESFVGYGQNDINVVSNGVGYHVMFSFYNDSDYSDTVDIMRYAVIDPDDASELVAPTPFRFHVDTGADNGVRRARTATLPNGNLLVVYQVYQIDLGFTQLRYLILDPSVAALDGDPLLEPVTATADGGNTGNGTMSDVEVALSAPTGTANWTVTCTDDSVAGSEEWSVEDDTDASYEDAVTGVTYTTETGGILFTIEAGGTDFAVGDAFTFTTANPALVLSEQELGDGINYHHPSVYADPNGAGVYVSFAEADNDTAPYDEIFYAVLGYDGAILEEPTQASDSDGGSDSIDWTYESAIALSGDRIVMSWVQYFTSSGDTTQVLFTDDNPVDVPAITDVAPDSGDEGTETEIVISGENFATGVAVFVGDTELTTVTRDSGSQITATVPDSLAAGEYDVKVVNPDTLFAVAADAFEVLTVGDDDDSDDDSDDDVGDDDASGDDDAADDDASGDDDDDDDDDGCCGC